MAFELYQEKLRPLVGAHSEELAPRREEVRRSEEKKKIIRMEYDPFVKLTIIILIREGACPLKLW